MLWIVSSHYHECCFWYSVTVFISYKNAARSWCACVRPSVNSRLIGDTTNRAITVPPTQPVVQHACTRGHTHMDIHAAHNMLHIHAWGECFLAVWSKEGREEEGEAKNILYYCHPLCMLLDIIQNSTSKKALMNIPLTLLTLPLLASCV